MNAYQVAWELLLRKIELKTGWGRNELKQAMLESLVEAGKQHSDPALNEWMRTAGS